MNILIVGNGFDLSHFLPTKYDHFMYAMKAILNYDNLDNEMMFDDIYKEIPNNETDFISKTKEIYDHTNVKLSHDQTLLFKNKLATNTWFQFFLKHVNDVKTWIDFEQKIEQALTYSVNAINLITEKHLKSKSFNIPIFTGPLNNTNHYFFTDLQFNILSCFNFIIADSANYASDMRSGRLNSNFFTSKEFDLYGFNSNGFINFLQVQLEEFIYLFNLYLMLIIDKLEPYHKFNVGELNSIEKVFSFNYTNTFEKFYKNNIEIEYLHGKFGSEQNLVLGISDIKDESLKNLKAYGFTKYHQKILKNTQYEFLNADITENKIYLNDLEEAKSLRAACASNQSYFKSYGNECAAIENKIKSKNINFVIWGHSLDISDEVYINEIFSFNEIIDNNVRVIVYYFNLNAKSELLANLFHILGKDKVEKWVKNNWLGFKLNPVTEAEIKPAVA